MQGEMRSEGSSAYRIAEPSGRNSTFYREVAKRNANGVLGTAVFLILSGVLFLWFGAVRGFPAFLIGIGVLYTAFGAYTFLRWRRLKKIVVSTNV